MDGADEHRLVIGTVVQKAGANLERSKGMVWSKTNDGSKKNRTEMKTC